MPLIAKLLVAFLVVCDLISLGFVILGISLMPYSVERDFILVILAGFILLVGLMGVVGVTASLYMFIRYRGWED